jgi:hypothetical protein
MKSSFKGRGKIARTWIGIVGEKGQIRVKYEG